MILEVGQYINDGKNDLVVCATIEYESKWYVYVINEETDEVGFYEIIDIGDSYKFSLVHDENLQSKLILEISKDYILKREKEGNPISAEELSVYNDVAKEISSKFQTKNQE